MPKVPDQRALVNKARPPERGVTSCQTSHLCPVCSLCPVGYNGRTGAHCVPVCFRQAHTGGLVRQVVRRVWTGSFLFTFFEGDVANWESYHEGSRNYSASTTVSICDR